MKLSHSQIYISLQTLQEKYIGSYLRSKEKGAEWRQKESARWTEEKQASEAVQAELQKMLLEVKRKLKNESKNELIRIIGALLLDNYALKIHLEEANSKLEVKNEA